MQLSFIFPFWSGLFLSVPIIRHRRDFFDLLIIDKEEFWENQKKGLRLLAFVIGLIFLRWFLARLTIHTNLMLRDLNFFSDVWQFIVFLKQATQDGIWKNKIFLSQVVFISHLFLAFIYFGFLISLGRMFGLRLISVPNKIQESKTILDLYSRCFYYIGVLLVDVFLKQFLYICSFLKFQRAKLLFAGFLTFVLGAYFRRLVFDFSGIFLFGIFEAASSNLIFLPYYFMVALLILVFNTRLSLRLSLYKINGWLRIFAFLVLQGLSLTVFSQPTIEMFLFVRSIH